ncbi:MAG: peroxidase-related enzyme [Planctomycetes bacterium]|nr:peroxidase-related enzyme [Planctomycetota bacterium]
MEVGDADRGKALRKDWRSLDWTEREHALCEYADKLTRRPQSMGREDLESLRRHGLSDEDLLDLVQITAYFNYINRVADALGVPSEPDWVADA